MMLAKTIQRLLAVSLAATALLLGVTMLLQPMWQSTRASLDRLSESRFAHARMQQLAAEVAQLKPAQVRADSAILNQQLIAAPDAQSAVAQLQSRIAGALSGHIVESLAVQPGKTQGILEANIAVSGVEGPLLGVLAQLEAAPPLITFEQVQIQAADVKARRIKVTLIATAQWQPRTARPQ